MITRSQGLLLNQIDPHDNASAHPNLLYRCSHWFLNSLASCTPQRHHRDWVRASLRRAMQLWHHNWQRLTIDNWHQNWDNSWINKKLWASHWNDKHDNWDVPNTLALKHWNIDRILQIRRETIEAAVKFVDVSGSTHCDAIAPLSQWHVDHCHVRSYMMWHESRIKKIRNWSIQLSAELGQNLGRNVAWKKGAFVNFLSLKPTLSSPRLN